MRGKYGKLLDANQCIQQKCSQIIFVDACVISFFRVSSDQRTSHSRFFLFCSCSFTKSKVCWSMETLQVSKVCSPSGEVWCSLFIVVVRWKPFTLDYVFDKGLLILLYCLTFHKMLVACMRILSYNFYFKGWTKIYCH